MGRFVISGGAGFIGSHLCDRLIGEGHEVLVLDNFITGRRANVAHLRAHPRFRLVEQDVSGPFAVDGAVDFVLHMASPASPPDFKRLPFETIRAGSFATHNLLDLAVEKKARFLLASTSEVYGDPPPEQHPQTEDYWGNVNPIGERSVYDEAKRYAEMLTMAYRRERGLDTRIVRIFNTYGPRMKPDDGRVVTNFIRQSLHGDALTLYGDGNQTRSFSYVTDTVDGIFRLLISNEPGPINIGNPVEFTVRELAERVTAMIPGAGPIITVELPFQDDPKQRRPDITRARTLLGWEPKVALDEGLQMTIDAVRTELEYTRRS